MPEVTAPWRVVTNPVGDASTAHGTSNGDLWCSAGVWIGAAANFAAIEQDLAAPSDASSLAVSMGAIDPQAFAGAGTFFGYAAAAVVLTLYAREGASSLEQHTDVVRATAPFLAYISDSLPRSGAPGTFSPPVIRWADLHAPGTPTLTFERPSSAPGAVTVGVRAECFAGSAGYLATGASSWVSMFVPDLTVEWFWNG